MVKCSIKLCPRDAKTDLGISFFRFPAELARCNEWMKAVGRPDLQGIDTQKLHQSKYRVCGVHFHTSSFSSMLLNRLKKDAIPVKFPIEAMPGPFFEGDDDELEKMMSSSSENTSEMESEKIKSKEECDNVNAVPDTEHHTPETGDNKNSVDKSELETNEKVESEDKNLIDDEKHLEANSIMKESQKNEIKNASNKETENTSNTELISSPSKGKETVENGISNSGTDKKMDTDENDDDEDDFNPLLLCPDISMDVEESPVVTAADPSQMNDPVDSNSLFAPLFSTFVDEMTGAEISFNLTAEEQQLREKLYGPNNPIQFTKVHCTACNVHLGSALAGQTNRFVHPLLKVLICKECYHFYTSGEFEKDEDGSELYCRWCGQGGQVLCCTMCEFVFCKKCIRINFGRKKLTQVRDSDDWKCFRCDMSQLKALRAMCVEFFEYVRSETARAASYNDPDIVNKDLTTCCQNPNKKRQNESDKESEKEVVKRPKRRKNEDEDPDYNPYAQEREDHPSSPVPSTSGVKVAANVSKPTTVIYPKLTPIPRTEVSFPGQSPSSTVRIGNTVINVKSLGTVPQANNSPPVVRNTTVRTPLLTNVRPKQTYTPRNPLQTANTRPPLSMPATGSLAHIRATSNKPSNMPVMKHEWFEKTVRAAARVNSNLSYTLTQLNKAQSSASSVEQLAVVHNKLQEILSSSINSLIQIRKNLRTEFIAGIKTIRFPPKPVLDPNDDDVIIVNTESSTLNATQNNKGVVPLSTQNSTKRIMKQIPSTLNRVNSSSSSNSSNNASNRGYLKVRSFSQLQTVSSECITIPDDDPPPSTTMEPIIVEVNEAETEESKEKNEKDPSISVDDDHSYIGNKVGDKVEIEPIQKIGIDKDADKESAIKNSQKEKDNCEKIKRIDVTNDKEKLVKEKNLKTSDSNKNVVSKSSSNDKDTNGSKKCNGNLTDSEVKVKTEPEESSYNVRDQPTAKIRRMLSVKVNLKKTPVVENMVKQEPVENGDN